MRINQDTVILLPGTEGRNTLQVPQADIEFGENGARVVEIYGQTEEYPDDYFMEITDNDSPIVGKQRGFLFLSPKGYAHFRNAILEARRVAPRHTDIESLDAYAEEWFAKIRQRKTKLLRDFQKKIDELNAFVI